MEHRDLVSRLIMEKKMETTIGFRVQGYGINSGKENGNYYSVGVYGLGFRIMGT